MDVPEIEPEIFKYIDIINKKHHVDIVTARRETDRDIVTAKLDSMGIKKGKQYNELVIVDYQPHTAKVDLDYEVYIDDSPELALAVSESKHKKIIVLFSQPWNASIDTLDLNMMTRADNWKEVLRHLKLLPCKWED